MDLLSNPIIISIVGSLLAVLFIYANNKLFKEDAVLDSKDYIKYLVIISLIIYGSIYLINKKPILTGGNNIQKEIFVGNPDF